MATPFRKALDTGRCMVRYGSGNTLIVKRALSLFRGAGVVPGCLHEQLPQVRVPALVMPPREVRSPLECSEETSPSQLAKARAESKRENTPASTVSANVVMVFIPFMHLSAAPQRDPVNEALRRIGPLSSRWPSSAIRYGAPRRCSSRGTLERQRRKARFLGSTPSAHGSSCLGAFHLR